MKKNKTLSVSSALIYALGILRSIFIGYALTASRRNFTIKCILRLTVIFFTHLQLSFLQQSLSAAFLILLSVR